MMRDWNVNVIYEDGTYYNVLNFKAVSKQAVLAKMVNDISLNHDKVLSITIVPVNKPNMEYFQQGDGQFER